MASGCVHDKRSLRYDNGKHGIERGINLSEKKWYKISAEEAIKKLESAAAGISTAEAEDRLKKYGSNELKEAKKYRLSCGSCFSLKMFL